MKGVKRMKTQKRKNEQESQESRERVLMLMRLLIPAVYLQLKEVKNKLVASATRL